MDLIPWDYRIESAYQIPLGGSQSSLCYLAEQLAGQGHEVFLLNNTPSKGLSRGVMCLPLQQISRQLLQSFDVVVEFNGTFIGRQIKPGLATKALLILWTQHAHDQPAVAPLCEPAVCSVYDYIIFISEWQKQQYQIQFNIDSSRATVLRNAVAPDFLNLFPGSTPVLPQKQQPSVLAYTSTPFRGLDILLDVFPEIRQAVPGTILKVFSSMKVYNVDEADDPYCHLYKKCREAEGVAYIGSVPRAELARGLSSASVLAYPNTFPETSCIAVMEAMAAGCQIVTSSMGALPETAAGFARLVPVDGDWSSYKERFVEETVDILNRFLCPDTAEIEKHLKNQIIHVNNACTWEAVSRQWIGWLSSKA